MMGKWRHPHLVYWSTLKIANDLYLGLFSFTWLYFLYSLRVCLRLPLTLWPLMKGLCSKCSTSYFDICSTPTFNCIPLYAISICDCILSCDVASVTTKYKHFVKMFLFLLCVRHGSHNLWSGKCCSVFLCSLKEHQCTLNLTECGPSVISIMLPNSIQHLLLSGHWWDMEKRLLKSKCNMIINLPRLTLSHPEALPWRVKSYSVRQSKITKGTVLASLGEKGLIWYLLYIFIFH